MIKKMFGAGGPLASRCVSTVWRRRLRRPPTRSEGVSITSGEGGVSVTLETSARVKTSTFALKNPERMSSSIFATPRKRRDCACLRASVAVDVIRTGVRPDDGPACRHRVEVDRQLARRVAAVRLRISAIGIVATRLRRSFVAVDVCEWAGAWLARVRSAAKAARCRAERRTTAASRRKVDREEHPRSGDVAKCQLPSARLRRQSCAEGTYVRLSTRRRWRSRHHRRSRCGPRRQGPRLDRSQRHVWKKTSCSRSRARWRSASTPSLACARTWFAMTTTSSFCATA